MSTTSLRSSAARLFYLLHELPGKMRNGGEIAGLGAGSEIASRAYGNRAGLDPLGDVLDADATGWHELRLRKWSFHRLHNEGPRISPGKTLTMSAPHSIASITSPIVPAPGM